MSARAAVRLATLGFTQVYRYVPGKADWFAAGLPREGKRAHTPRAANVARRDVPTCGLGESVGDVRERVRAAGWHECLVVDDAKVVLGRLRGKALDADPRTPVDEVMEPGPVTIRPNTLLRSVVENLREKHVDEILVTTSDGELIGSLFLGNAERRLTESGEQSQDAEGAGA
ncbi:MAG: CBS domain-containing protein [Dehalococcoidia bacterium]